MTDKFVSARNTVSGVVGRVPATYLTHPHFKNQYVLVDSEAKNFVPALYTPKTVDEFTKAHEPVVKTAGKATSPAKSEDEE